MTAAISVAGLTRRYRGQIALDDVTLDFEPMSITGLLGRNAAGKTTFMRIVAGQEFASAGSVKVLGADPVRNEAVLHRIALVREDQVYGAPSLQVRHALKIASWFHQNWDAGFTESLVDDFRLPTKRKVKNLSRGQRSALGIVIGLAARAEVTLFDEPYAGLDPVARQIFYDRLLADWSEHPRTVLLSTHLVDEVAGLLQRVVVIDRGRVALDAAAAELREHATGVRGPAAAVEQFAAGRRVWDPRRLAAEESLVVIGALDDADRASAHALGLDLEPLTLQQAVVHAVLTPTAQKPYDPNTNDTPERIGA